MTKIYQSGFELNTGTVDLQTKVKPFKHLKGCDKKTKSESTAHFVFIGCDCQRSKIKVSNEPNNTN